MKIIVLGGGLIDGPMAMDLAADNDVNVTVADISDKTLDHFSNDPGIKTIKQDLPYKDGIYRIQGDCGPGINNNLEIIEQTEGLRPPSCQAGICYR